MIKKLLFITTFLFVATSVFVTIETVSSGSDMSVLKKKEIGLGIKKEELETKLTDTISLTNIKSDSGEIGFVKPTELMYVGSSSNVANKN